jgi:hypothetical protein
MSDTVKNHMRHVRTYRILKTLLSPFFKRLFRIHSQPAPDITGPYLVLANHNAELDPVIIHFSFKELLYFVASEHVFRAGFASRLLIRYFDPISRLKGGTDISTAREVIRRLKNGMNICIFAEGNCSFNGLTCPIPPSTGRLAKVCGVPLITYKFEGGYFTTPRWAYTMRHGRMRGYVVNVYSPEQLKAMSADEVNAAIAADLFEDAYARQATEKVRFKGKRLAEGLETALFLCPKCERFSTLHSRDNEFYCDCGLKAVYDEYGYLSGAPYSTITEWDAWQHNKLAQIASNLGEKAVFEDADIRLVRVHADHKSEIVYSGATAMYRDRIVCGDLTFFIHDISDMAIYSRASITFTCGSGHYEIVSSALFCGRRYLELYNQLKAMR